MKKKLLIATAALAITHTSTVASAGSTTDKDGCLLYDRQVTLTGTVRMSKVPEDSSPGEKGGLFPLLILNEAICASGPENETETIQWALHVTALSCKWPVNSPVRVNGTAKTQFQLASTHTSVHRC